jgi:hypothetical protein
MFGVVYARFMMTSTPWKDIQVESEVLPNLNSVWLPSRSSGEILILFTMTCSTKFAKKMNFS